MKRSLLQTLWSKQWKLCKFPLLQSIKFYIVWLGTVLYCDNIWYEHFSWTLISGFFKKVVGPESGNVCAFTVSPLLEESYFYLSNFFWRNSTQFLAKMPSKTFSHFDSGRNHKTYFFLFIYPKSIIQYPIKNVLCSLQFLV